MKKRLRKWKYVCGLLSVTAVLVISSSAVATAGNENWNPSGLRWVKQLELRQAKAQDTLSQKKIVVPENIRKICKAKGEQYGISPYMLMAICYKESRFNVTAQNGPCKGLCQVNVNYYPHNWRNPETNIDAACRCITGIIDTWGLEDLGDIMSYYHGEGKAGYSNYTKDIDEISNLLMEEDGVY